MIDLVEKGIIRPTICQTFPLPEIKEAYRCMEGRENIGKIVVTIPEEYRFKGTGEISAIVAYDSIPHVSRQKEPIAIIGMSGRFAQSGNVNELWQHLANGRDLIEEVSRWDLSQYYPQEATYCNHGGFIDGIDQFDPLFFKISGVEATYMDPQQRLFLEESWKALENAGYADPHSDGRRWGIYAGCANGDY